MKDPFERALERLRAICLALPDTKETLTWGEPHFRVGEKIFAGIGAGKGKAEMSFKLEREHADLVVNDPRFWRAPYVGHKGWVSMDPTAVTDWEEVRALVHESYRLIAPKRSLAKLAGGAAAPRRAPRAGSHPAKARRRTKER